jgi:hypothetical protein
MNEASLYRIENFLHHPRLFEDTTNKCYVTVMEVINAIPVDEIAQTYFSVADRMFKEIENEEIIYEKSILRALRFALIGEHLLRTGMLSANAKSLMRIGGIPYDWNDYDNLVNNSRTKNHWSTLLAKGKEIIATWKNDT